LDTCNYQVDKIGKQSTTQATLCSVCIATYRRPHFLEKLLLSLRNQRLPDAVAIEIIVVDNDLHKSAEPIIEKFKHISGCTIYYYNQIIKNISLTRNLAVEKSSGNYILFIDDDEVASSQWVYHLLNTIEKFNADGVFGPILLEFNPSTPKWMQRRDLFYPEITYTGAKPEFMGTGNCIFKASLLKGMKEPFDIRYGITGGEDTHLFQKLENEGRHFVFCKEAVAIEYLPPSRTKVLYLFLRGLRGGNTHTRRTIEFAGERKNWVRLYMVSKSLCYGVVSFLLMITQIQNSVRRTRWLIKFGSNIGRFMAVFGWYYEGYR
jgi:succinoglycan biosynthesis protein ExoM